MERPVSTGLSSRERALLDLARRAKVNVGETFAAVTEATAVTLEVARVSIWTLENASSDEAEVAATRAICRDLYLMHERKHVSSLPLYGREFPAYLQALQTRRTVVADDAENDPRTREFAEFYLKPLGITSMLDVPIWHDGRLYGVLCLEHVGALRTWKQAEQDFAIDMTDIISTSLEAAEHAAAKRRLESLVDSLAEGVILLDRDGSIVRCNRTATQSFFIDERLRTLDGRRSMVTLVDAADRPIPPNDWPFSRAVRGEELKDEIIGVVTNRTGTRQYLRLTATRSIENGKFEYVAFVMSDATEEVFVERLKREFLSRLAHELKTPLAIAKGYAQQLSSDPQIAHPYRRMLDAITRSCDRMDHLSETMLDLSSIVLGRLRLTREEVDLSTIAMAVVQRAESSAPGQRFVVKIEGSLPVMVDCTRIAQAMRQVVDNALTFSSSDSLIDVELSSQAGKAIMSVHDNGIGVPAGARQGLFKMFYKAHIGTEYDKGGLGIGLYLAREILRHHDGEILFDSVEGKGSTVRIELPLAEPS